MAEHVERAPHHATGHREPSEHTRPHTMSRTTRTLVGVLAFVPLLLVSATLGALMSRPEDAHMAELLSTAGVGALLYGTMLMLFLLIVFFGAFVMNNRRIGGTSRGLWLAGFLLGGPLVIPLYWYIHVLHAPRRGFHN